MKLLNVLTFFLIIVGGLNWGLVGLFEWDWFAGLFGEATMPARIAQVVIGAAALWQLFPLISAFESDPSHGSTRR